MSFWYYFQIDHQNVLHELGAARYMQEKSKHLLYNTFIRNYAGRKTKISHPPNYFLGVASNVFPDVRSVGRIEKKKSQEVEVNIRILGLTKCTVYCKSGLVFVPVLLYAVTICSFFQIKRIISSDDGRTTRLDGEKKEDGLKSQLSKISPSLIIIATSFSVILLIANNIVPLCLSPDQGD